MIETGQPVIKETIRLEIETPKAVGGGLADLVRQLENVHAHILKVNEALNGMKLGPSAARSTEVLLAQIKAMQTKVAAQGGDILKLPDLTKHLGVDSSQFEAFLARRRKALKDHYGFSTQLFSSATQAAKQVSAFERESVGGRKVALGQLLTPSIQSVQVGSVTAPGAGVAAKVEGQIPLTIPAAQVQASVIGNITLNIPGAQVTGTGVGRGPDGRFLPATGSAGPPEGGAPTGGGNGEAGGGGGGGRKRKKKGGPLDIPAQPGEFERLRVETDEWTRETVTRANALGQTVSETWDSVEQAIIKTVRKSTTGLSPLKEFQTRKALAQQNFLAAKAKVAPTDLKALAQLQYDQGAQTRAILADPALQKALGPAETKRLQALLEARAEVFEAQGRRTHQAYLEREKAAQARRTESARRTTLRHQTAEVEAERRIAAQEVRNERKRLAGMYSDTWTGKQQLWSGLATAESERADRLEQALAKNKLIRGRQRRSVEADVRGARLNAANFTRMAGGGDPKAGVPTGEYARFLSGLRAFTPMGALANLTKVTGWAASVMVLYKSLELAHYSMSRFIEIGQQTARLEQVFHGVGGSAKELTDDIMKLASANGRSTSEAMESATEWARLGLTRAQTNEAVRVSLTAANVADMHAKETTKQLSSLMHIYNLEVQDLSGVLGMLTSTSQHYNVTLEDLFTGLDRSAGTAKQAGMSLAELQGIIGATVGKTGQSGIIVGNTVKSILTQFSNPTMQKFLRSYGIETLTEGLQQKTGSQILRDRFVRYQSMDSRERQGLTQVLAGRLQGGRFVAMMDSYLQAQKLAIDAQLDLNRAQEANARILGTLKTQMAGVRAEWDRLAVAAGNKFGPSLTSGVRLTKNLLRWFNEPSAPDSKAEEFQRRFIDKTYDKENYRKYLETYQKEHDGQLPGFWSIAFPKIKGPQGNLGGDQALGIWLALKEESPFERGAAEFANKAQEHRNRAASHAMRSRFFETVSEVIGVANRPEVAKSAAEMAAGYMDPASADAFNRLLAAGKKGEAQKFLGEQAKQYRGRSVEEVAAAATERGKRYAEGKGAVATLDGEIAKLKEKGAAEDVIADKAAKRAQIEQELREYDKENIADLDFYDEEKSKTEEVLSLKQKYVDLLKEQELVMQSIDQLAQQDGLETMGSRLEAQVEALGQNIETLEGTWKRLREMGDTESLKAAEQIQQQIIEKSAHRAAMDSPQMREAANIYDERQIAGRRAREEAQSYHVGYGESSKLLNEERELQAQLRTLRAGRANGPLNENDTVRAKQLEIELWNTQERIQARIVELAREEKQIRIDAAKEFNKGLLLAGPGEMLQRLHVAQLMRRPGGVSAGEFFAMSPETRRMYFEAMGGEAGMTNRFERRQMQGHRQPVSQEQANERAARERVNRWNADLNRATHDRIGRQPEMPLPHLDSTARNVAAMGNAAINTAGALNRLTAAVDQLLNKIGRRSNGREVAASGMSLGISAGFSLGSQSG